MAYRILAEIFADREARVVRVPLSSGRGPKKDTPPEEKFKNCSDDVHAFAPQYGAGGSRLSSSDPGSSTLVSTLEFVQRSHSDLAKRIYGRSAREKLRRTGVASEYFDENKDNWWFLTLTYPTGSKEGMVAIAENSGWIVQQLKNFMRGFENGPPTFFYCWEKQKRGTLHLHYCVHLPDADSTGFNHQRFHAWAVGHVHSLSSRSGCNLWVSNRGTDWSKFSHVLRAEAQRVKKSVSRYLAKYCSKQATKDSIQSADCPSPRRFWGRSRNLHEKVKALTVKSWKDCESFNSATTLFSNLVDALRLFHPRSVVYYNRLTDCEGESFSLFKESPCLRLTSYMKHCLKHTQGSKTQSPTQNTPSPSPNSMLQETMETMTLSLPKLPRLLRKSENYKNYLRQIALLENSSVQHWQSRSADLNLALLDLTDEFCTSRYRSNAAVNSAMKVLKDGHSKLLWMMRTVPSSRLDIFQSWSSWATQELGTLTHQIFTHPEIIEQLRIVN